MDVSSGVELPAPVSNVQRKYKPCMNAPECREIIVDEGKHIRYCRRCRQGQTRREAEVDMEWGARVFSRAQLERFGIGRDGWFGEDLADWSVDD